MRNVIRQLILCAVFGSLLFPALAAAAQDDPVVHAPAAAAAQDDPVVEGYGKMITEAQHTVDDWKSSARWQKGIVITLAALGGLIILLQQLGAQKKWCIVCVAFVGFLITSLTAVHNFAFSADYKTLDNAAPRARWILTSAISTLNRLKATKNENGREPLIQELDGQLERFNGFVILVSSGESNDAATASPTGASTDASSWIVSTAYAQAGSGPRWIHVPVSKTFIAYRFAGTGDAKSLSKAREIANRNAQKEAANRFSVSRQVFARRGKEVDSYVRYDRKARRYHYSTLIEINRVWVRR